ncbi:MAG: hypothetical protein AW07_00503 [Candidatus Accumulibacter sp. SK-11]|nr:MAG: hypothetical protein AW07_00503 [Candidatus Accumulibacter sp. SK-11]
MAEALADLASEFGFADHLRPVEQQVVIIQHLLCLFAVHVLAEQASQLGLPLGTPRKARLQHFAQGRLGVQHGRIDGEAGSFQREALFPGGEAEAVAGEVQQVGRILPVLDREAGVDADACGVFAQQACTDAVEGAGPGQRRNR